MRNEQNKIKAALENYYKDAVDIEFIFQEGKLWVLQARPAKRKGLANLKINIDLFFENVIDLNEVISRIKFRDFEEVLAPTIQNEEELSIIGEGLPASQGAATGQVFFFANDVLDRKSQKCILCRIGYSPEDLSGMNTAAGLVSSRGGMTSHAAVVSRGMGKPCVSGIYGLEIDYHKRTALFDNYQIHEGDWITINGSNGHIYKGKGEVISVDWRNNEQLKILYRIVEKAIGTNSLNVECIGKAWLFRDFFNHNIPLWHVKTKKQSVNNTEYISFKQPSNSDLKKIDQKLNGIPAENEHLIQILQGLRSSLHRQLSGKVGIGNHFKYYRPLLDPMLSITTHSNYPYENIKLQLLGEEFYNIGRYIPNLIDIYKVTILVEIETNTDNGLSFLDFTNPRGESLVVKDYNVKRFCLEINDIPIESDMLPNLYNKFRKREYFWNWYSENLTSHREMLDFINLPKNERINIFRLNTYAHELELLEENELTKSGKALIFR